MNFFFLKFPKPHFLVYFNHFCFVFFSPLRCLSSFVCLQSLPMNLIAIQKINHFAQFFLKKIIHKIGRLLFLKYNYKFLKFSNPQKQNFKKNSPHKNHWHFNSSTHGFKVSFSFEGGPRLTLCFSMSYNYAVHLFLPHCQENHHMQTIFQLFNVMLFHVLTLNWVYFSIRKFLKECRVKLKE